MKHLAKRLLQSLLSPFGLKLVRKHTARSEDTSAYAMPDCLSRLRHAKALGFHALDIVDAGAFTGQWAAAVAPLFPDSRVLLIEPNPAVLEEIAKNTDFLGSRVICEAVAVSDCTSTMSLDIWGDPGRATSASLHAHVKGSPDQAVEVRVETIDALIEKHKLSPTLIKIDLQGGELAALRGATRALQSSELVVVEFGCLAAYLDRTNPRELLDLLYDHRYCLYDIVDCHYRPYDGALTGGDFFFVKNDSPLKSHADYH